MKKWTLIWAWMAASLPAMAAPVPKDCIAADVKWLLHLDAEEFCETSIGKTIAKDYLDPNWQKTLPMIKAFINVDLDWRALKSITIYSTEIKPDDKGVLLIETDKPARQQLEKALLQKSLKTNDAAEDVEVPTNSPGSILSIGSDFFASAQKDNLMVLSKSRPALEKALDVIGGKSPNLKSGEAFSSFSADPKGMFLVILADGFVAPDQLPPQAQIFKQADGGKLALGEKGDRLFLSLALKAKTEDGGKQMQQVLQGLLALGTLSQNENQDVTTLLNAIKITAEGKIVTVSVDYPSNEALEKITAAIEKKHAQKESREKRKEKRKQQKSKPAEQADQADKPEKQDKQDKQ